MSNSERTRQVITGEFGADQLQQKLSEGWRPVVIEWEREIVTQAAITAPAPEVPYGLRVSGDCAHLEADPSEREVLFQIMELTIQDGPYSGIAVELNRRGYRTRTGQPWTPISVFQMLPRLIEAGPGILNSDEWRERRKKIKGTTA
jgi:hypothetical protein